MSRNSNIEHYRNLQAQFRDLEGKYKDEVQKNKSLTDRVQALQEANDDDYQNYEEDQRYRVSDSGEDEGQPQGQPQHHRGQPTEELQELENHNGFHRGGSKDSSKYQEGT